MIANDCGRCEILLHLSLDQGHGRGRRSEDVGLLSGAAASIVMAPPVPRPPAIGPCPPPIAVLPGHNCASLVRLTRGVFYGRLRVSCTDCSSPLHARLLDRQKLTIGSSTLGLFWSISDSTSS